MDPETILWRRLDRPGHEAARLFTIESGWRLAGTAVFLQDGLPVRLDYHIELNSMWQTARAKVSGWVGVETVAFEIAVDSGLRWTLNGIAVPEVTGCRDIDLAFSPSTNLIPVRRLNLTIGQAAEVRAAWLRFPEFTLEPLAQEYRRVGPGDYHYASAGGAFTAELAVTPSGLVTYYPGFWAAE